MEGKELDKSPYCKKVFKKTDQDLQALKNHYIKQWRIANPELEIIAKAPRIGFYGKLKVALADFEVNHLGKIKFSPLNIIYRQKDIKDMFGFKLRPEKSHFICSIGLISLCVNIYIVYQYLNDKKLLHDTQEKLPSYPFEEIKTTPHHDEIEPFSGLQDYDLQTIKNNFDKEGKLFLKQATEQQLLTDKKESSDSKHPENLKLEKMQTNIATNRSGSSRLRSQKSLLPNQSTTFPSITKADLIQQHKEAMKKRNRVPFEAWGQINNRPVLFLGDYNNDEFHRVYDSPSSRKQAQNALARIAVKKNQAGLKHMESRYFELKTVGGTSGHIRCFGGTAFPSLYKNPNNKTDIFYISLEKNPGLAKKARQKK